MASNRIMVTPLTYSKTITVRKDVIDHFNHVNNLAYVRWALEVSKEHWNTMTSKDIQNTYGWMIMRHELRYLKQAKLGDELIFNTRIQKYSAATSQRKTEIVFKDSHQLIFESLADWCFVKIDTQKPTRITEDIINRFYTS